MSKSLFVTFTANKLKENRRGKINGEKKRLTNI